MYMILIALLTRLGYKIVQEVRPEHTGEPLQLLAKHPNGFVVKLQYQYMDRSEAIHPQKFSIELFMEIESGKMFKWMAVGKNLIFKHRDNLAEVNMFDACSQILTQIAEGYFSRKGTLDVKFADPTLRQPAEV